ncbi:T9SS type A sorting domain-containing protein [Kordia zhangzhouensis]|uniref:T9SS type A sorting domain-containing protein n=1 Tax=Kordia zhangzhouensis TaxID=1620405 RepID=UPI00062909CF|nr:T9SS type A sorting domain-containing protein [Kordia zhangzhouensis]
MDRTKKRRIFYVLLFLAIIGYLISSKKKQEQQKDRSKTLKQQHALYLKNSPFSTSRYLSRTDRKTQGLPPNAYFEQQWELTINPSLGRPTPENLVRLQRELATQNIQERTPGDGIDNNWEERGPNDIGGRTRAILFDPNDINNPNPNDDYTRVFAGSVSGGLWVNDDITDANTSWQLVTGLPDNISVTVIIADPNDSNILYLGSGESYTNGYGVGSGVYKSTDGGITWQQVLGGNVGTASADGASYYVDGIFHVNDLVARNNNGTTEIYAAIASAAYRDASSPFNILGFDERGVYKSDTGGSSWTRFPIQYPGGGTYLNPNDIEIDNNNDIWLATTNDFFNNPGGYIYQSTDGNSFQLIYTFPNAQRTEIEPSQINSGTFWILAEINRQADLFVTTNNFNTVNSFVEPVDADSGIPATDFTRGQAFFDLVIEADVNDNLYVGGIDLFKYNASNANWDQISKWKNDSGLQNITASFVHADQHAIVFRPNNNNHAVIGNDGGVYFSDTFSAATNNAAAISHRVKNYNVTQFYYGAIAEGDIVDGDDILGGTQDNGSLAAIDASSQINSFTPVITGDGAFTEIDEADGYAIISFPFLNHAYIPYPSLDIFSGYFIAFESNPSSFREGEFINAAELDKTNNVLFTNASISNGAFQIGKHSNINGGNGNVVTFEFTDPLLDNAPTALKISADGHTLYAGLKNGRLLKITNAHTETPTFTDISDASFVGSISDIEFGQSENELLVTFHNYGITNIWYSTNQGITWENKEGDFPDIPVKCILMNPLLTNGEEVIIGTELGVWRTQNFNTNSPNWTRSDNGMRAVAVLDLDLRTSDNTVLATTHGRGFFTGQFLPGTLSTDEISSVNAFKIYPTVSDGTIYIQSDMNGKATMELITLEGKRVVSREMNLRKGQAIKLSLNEFSSGIYLLQIQQGARSQVTKIVIN